MPNWSDRNEAIFRARMLLIKDLKIVYARTKQLTCFGEANTMLPLIRAILAIVPRELHLGSVSSAFDKSMAYYPRSRPRVVFGGPFQGASLLDPPQELSLRVLQDTRRIAGYGIEASARRANPCTEHRSGRRG